MIFIKTKGWNTPLWK